jgi:hypothetical protein
VSAALWAQGRAAFLQAQPLTAALVLPLQRVLFSEWPASWDPVADAPSATPDFAAPRTLALADPGARVDHLVRRLARAYTALALALEQPAMALLPMSRRGAWLPTLNARHHAPLVRARAALEPLALGPRFNGALWFRAEAVPDALRLWFWAERTGVIPGGLVSVWTLPGGALRMQLCAHGNLHVDVYGAAALEALDAWAPACGWMAVQGHCVSAWQQGTAIAGRGLRV